MIKEIQKNMHIIRLIVILCIFTALVTEDNKVTIEAKPLIGQLEISFMNPSLYYQRKISDGNLITNSKLKDKAIPLIANDVNQIIDIPDIELKKQLNRTLGKLATDDITLDELQSLTSLEIYGYNILSIEGLQYATNLEQLSLHSTQVSDISALGEGNFGNLTSLDLGSNQINDISALGEGNLENLTSLYLNNNQINDISALGEGNLSNLTSLDLSSNQIIDISALGEGNLSNLTSLGLSDNQITDISGLGEGNLSNLTSLGLRYNQIIDISALGEGSFGNLTNLYLNNNQITNLNGLGEGNLVNLKNLYLQHNKIHDISALGEGNFENLTFLSMWDNQISDISALGKGNFRNLRTLDLENNQIMDISVLSDFSLPKLMGLLLDNQTVSLEPIDVLEGQSVIILNPVIDNRGKYITPYNFNGRYDYDQNKLIWDEIYQSQEVNFDFSEEIYFNQGTAIFSGTVTVPIKVTSSKEDVNQDGIIDEQDLKFISQWYNVTSDSPLWNLELDLNRDGIIDLFDLVLISNKIDHEYE